MGHNLGRLLGCGGQTGDQDGSIGRCQNPRSLRNTIQLDEQLLFELLMVSTMMRLKCRSSPVSRYSGVGAVWQLCLLSHLQEK